ncbi:MAG: prolyl oligopeptidase family serine peptidase, partial [Oscillospiraceae bacterium]|nr:prolyl oligopeptidase family serine peptidase [Oscillospiraceae bacterium]
TNQFEYNPIANWAGDGFQKLFAQGGAYIITPRANEDLRPGHGISWNRLQTAPLFAALEDFVKTHPDADARRIYVGGYSMGGGMTWLLIRERPDFFAAAVPCCPRLDYAADDFSDQEALNAALAPLAGLPIWEIHGEGDSVTPPEQSVPLRRALLSNAAAANTDTRFLTLPTGYLFPDGKTPTPVDHLVWIPALNNLLFDDGAPYRDVSGALVETTLIEWLNACPDSPEKL